MRGKPSYKASEYAQHRDRPEAVKVVPSDPSNAAAQQKMRMQKGEGKLSYQDKQFNQFNNSEWVQGAEFTS